MKRSIVSMLTEFKMHWKNYVFQSLFATCVLFVVMLYLGVHRSVIVASIGATAFLVFALPQKSLSQPRNVIGGHLVGLISGCLSVLVMKYAPSDSEYILAMVYAFSVGFSMFVMVVVDMEHPPGSGTALGIAVGGFSWDVLATVMISAVILSLIHHFAKSYLRDLE